MRFWWRFFHHGSGKCEKKRRTLASGATRGSAKRASSAKTRARDAWPSFARRAVDDGGPLAPDLEAEERRARLGGGALDDEPAAPGTELDLEPLAAHERAQVDVLSFGEAGVRRHTARGLCDTRVAARGLRVPTPR